jgi:hypothetical protein
MHPIVRHALAVLAGAGTAVLIVTLSDGVVRVLYPPLAGADFGDTESVRALVEAMPLQALLVLVTGWAIAAGVGAFAAIRLTVDRRASAGWIVAGLIVASTIANLFMVPHPVWMWPLALVLVPLGGWLGVSAGAGGRAARGASPREPAGV